MTDVYRVGVSFVLNNMVSDGLSLIARQFSSTNAQALALKATLIGIASVGLYKVGMEFKGAMSDAAEYYHEINKMNMAGMKHAEVVQAIGAAWKNTHDVMTTTAPENLKTLLDLRNVTGSVNEAVSLLPIVTKIQAAMQASSDAGVSSRAKEFGYSMAKALDVIGAVRNPVEMERQASMMAKAIIATGGRVTPEAMQQTFTYARQAKFDLSNEFKYEILPSLIQEFASRGGGGGGSKGVGPALAALYRVTNQGYVNSKAVGELAALGLVDPATALKTTTSGTTTGPLKDNILAASNPFQWVNGVLVPAIQRRYGAQATDSFIRQEIGNVFRGNQLAAAVAMEFYTKRGNFVRDQGIIKNTESYTKAFSRAENDDYYTIMREFSAQWKNLKLELVKGFFPNVIAFMRGLTDITSYFNKAFSGGGGLGSLTKAAGDSVYGAVDTVLNLGRLWGLRDAPNPPKVKTTNYGTTVVQIDGREVGRAATVYQSKSLSLPQSGYSNTDGRLSLSGVVGN